MTDSDTMPYPEQADLMHGLIDAGHLTVKGVGFGAETSERTAYRIVSGDTPLTVMAFRAITRANDAIGNRAVGDALARFAYRGTNRLAVDLTTSDRGDVHRDTIEALRQLANLLEQRRQHEADGVITDLERREEVKAIDGCLHVLHRARKAAAEQTTRERKKCRPLAIADGGAA